MFLCKISVRRACMRDNPIGFDDSRVLMRLCVVVSSLRYGGAEGVAAKLALMWTRMGHEVVVLTFEPASADSQRALNGAVVVRALDCTGESRTLVEAILVNFRRLARIRRELVECRADAVVSHLDSTNVLVLLATVGMRLKIFPVEHVDPRAHQLKRSWKLLRWICYRRATRLIVVSRGIADAFPERIRRRIVVIHNPIDAPPEGPMPSLHASRIVAMGRLVPQKGFDLLLQAFAQIHDRHPTAQLTIWGEGSKRTDLQSQAQRLGLAAKVAFPGFTPAPLEALRAGSIFVFPSRFEGFGLALAEAMSVGLPVIATDCPSGPADIVHHGIDGLLVPNEDVDALARALDRLLSDADLRARLARQAPAVIERFSFATVIPLWDNVLRLN